MKKIPTKPVLAVLAAATLTGGITPVLASSIGDSGGYEGIKVVMEPTEEAAQRYRLKELLENNEALLNLLLKTQLDDLYVVVESIGLAQKLSKLMEHEEAWKKLLEEHFDEILLEVRRDEEDCFVKLEQETKDGITYIRGRVTGDVTRVVIQTPESEIKVENFVDQSFIVSFPVVISAAPVYVTLKAYGGSKLMDTERIRVNAGTVLENDLVLHAMGVYLSDKGEVKVNGLVDADVDRVRVRYGEKEKEVQPKKLWSGVKAFSVSFPADEDGYLPVKAVVEAYRDGQLLDERSVEIVDLKQRDQDEATFAIKGAATLNAKNKTVHVKGTVTVTGDPDGKLKLVVVAPDGKRHEINRNGKGEFEATVPYLNRSFNAKAVRVELYVDGKLAYYADLPHGVPQNATSPKVKPVQKDVTQGKEKEKGTPSEQEKGNKRG